MSRRNDPFDEMERVFDRLARQFEDMSRNWDRLPQRGLGSLGESTISVDLADRDDEFVLTADVPGFETDEIDLRLRDDVVVITAEREQSSEEEGDEGDYIRSEREHRSLVESVRVPQPVDEDGASAEYRNGVLTVHLPKAEPSEEDGKRIEIG